MEWRACAVHVCARMGVFCACVSSQHGDLRVPQQYKITGHVPQKLLVPTRAISDHRPTIRVSTARAFASPRPAHTRLRCVRARPRARDAPAGGGATLVRFRCVQPRPSYVKTFAAKPIRFGAHDEETARPPRGPYVQQCRPRESRMLRSL